MTTVTDSPGNSAIAPLQTVAQLTHLQRLEAESIHIMREVVAECERPVMLYSIGKDSSVMLHLAIKAFHLHKRQTDVWYVPPSDKLLLVVADVRKGSPSEGLVQRIVLGDGNSRLVRIPPGVAHGVKNLAATRGRIIYLVDTHFSPDPDTSDEGRLPWDFAGIDVWEPTRG